MGTLCETIRIFNAHTRRVWNANMSLADKHWIYTGWVEGFVLVEKVMGYLRLSKGQSTGKLCIVAMMWYTMVYYEII